MKNEYKFILVFLPILMVACQNNIGRQVVYPTEILKDGAVFFARGYYREEEYEGLLVGSLEINEGSIRLDREKPNTFWLGFTLILKNVSNQAIQFKKPCSMGLYQISIDGFFLAPRNDINVYVETLNGESAIRVPEIIGAIPRGNNCLERENFVVLEPGDSYEYQVDEYKIEMLEGMSPGEYVIGVFFQNTVVGYSEIGEGNMPYYVDIGACVGFVETNQVKIFLPEISGD